MKKLLLLLLLLMISCTSNESLEVVKSDIKSSGKLSDLELQTIKFKTLEMISKDGRNDLLKLSLNRKMKILKEGAVYGGAFDICQPDEIKENDKILKIEAYRIAGDTVYKSIFYTKDDKIVGRFLMRW